MLEMLKRQPLGFFVDLLSKDQTRTAHCIPIRKVGADSEIMLAITPSLLDRMQQRANDNIPEQEIPLYPGLMTMVENQNREFGSDEWYYRFRAIVNQSQIVEYFMTKTEFEESAKDAYDYYT